MIQHKLAEMAIRIYAAESMTYRVDGPDRSRSSKASPGTQPNAAADAC